MFRKLRQWWERRRAMDEFHCAFWCPNCNEEAHYHAHKTWEAGYETLVSACSCGHVSRWHWGAPVPILLPSKPNLNDSAIE